MSTALPRSIRDVGLAQNRAFLGVGERELERPQEARRRHGPAPGRADRG